jgi:N6-adenosine-specific RNA methylase IME4
MTQIARPGLRAVDEATTIGEAKTLRDKAAAVEAYAREARDTELLDHAVEVRLRAERQAGRLLIDMTARGERAKSGDADGSTRKPSLPTLADLGLTKAQSHRWQQLARMDEVGFVARLAEARRTAWAAVELTPKERQAEKRERRATRERDLGARQRQLPETRYGVVYADPPWSFEPFSAETGMDRAADNHYPTMTLAEIAALKVPVAEDAVLFLWATAPMLPEALAVMSAWDFAYKSHFVWTKDKAGTGYWNRNKHELLLIGTRGQVPAPAPGEQYESVIPAPRGEHSAKPFAFREIIDDLFPTLPKIELFARGEASAGWVVWGNEAA